MKACFFWQAFSSMCSNHINCSTWERRNAGWIIHHHKAFIWNVTSSTGRRKTITEAELNEFKTQIECLGWFNPLIFTSDHGEKKSSYRVRCLNNELFSIESNHYSLQCHSNTLVYCSMQYMPWSCALGNGIQDSVIYFVSTGCSLMFFFFFLLHRLSKLQVNWQLRWWHWFFSIISFNCSKTGKLLHRVAKVFHSPCS